LQQLGGVEALSSDQLVCCRSILVAERVALNFMQRMSGIASLTRQMVLAVQVNSRQHSDSAVQA
jgi:nicotinate-nucleotide pyrophosphorylase